MSDFGTIIQNIGHLLVYHDREPLLFSSGLFWVMFLVFLPVFAWLRHRRTMMMAFVIGFSLYFYYKTSGVFVLLLLTTSLLDWILSQAIAHSRQPWERRASLGLSLLFSLGVLAYYKYAHLSMWSWDAMVTGNFQPADVILPVGISFYTFQSASYIIDVYRGKVQPTRTWMEYAFFLTFFPALVAGPIVRADNFLPQIHRTDRPTRADLYLGLWLVILGVTKKAVIADYIAQYNDLVFGSAGTYNGVETLMGIIGYMMQIYCDFSGYSDMAIGLSMMMGFILPKNFDFPYKARNIGQFWRRWHISLSSWIRDYVYIPLGGSRKGTARTYINNMATMLLAGLWHGVGIKFLIWGGLHGAALVVHRALQPWLRRIPDTWWVKAASWTVNMVFLMVTFVFFRAPSFVDATRMLRTVLHGTSLSHLWPFVAVRHTWVMMLAVIIAAHAMPTRWWERAAAWFVESPWVAKLLVFAVCVQLIIEFSSAEVVPFIYFQF